MKKRALVLGALALAMVSQGVEVRQYDVVVVGGGVDAVAAAVAAQQAGRSVFLVAPRPYLGEDMAGTLELVRSPDDDQSSPLFATLFPTNLVSSAVASSKAGSLAAETTPLTVKRALDQALLDAGVEYITGVAATEVRGKDGRVVEVQCQGAGAPFMLATKALIDATSRGYLAEQAGGKRHPFTSGTYEFSRMIMATAAPEIASSVRSEPVGEERSVVIQHHGAGRAKNVPDKVQGRYWRVHVPVQLEAAGAAELAEAEWKTRALIQVWDQLEIADEIRLDLPDRFVGAASATVWAGGAELDLAAMKPQGTTNVWVLGATGDVTPEVAAKLAQPGNAAVVGERLGKAVAAFVAAEAPGGAEAGEEPYAGRLVEVACDVLVAGAGTGGSPAAIAAAREGARVLVVDYLHRMGGMSTEGMIGGYYFGNICGFTKEIDAGVAKSGEVMTQAKDRWYREELARAGGTFWGGVRVVDVVLDDARRKIQGAILVMPDGSKARVKCQVAIDATGNSVLAYLAGAETEYLAADELSIQGAGMQMRAPGRSTSNFDIGFLDVNDPEDLFRFALRSRFSINAKEWDQSQLPGSRERRRTKGAFYIMPQDIICGRTYPDTIERSYSNFDSHGQTVHPAFFIEGPQHQGLYANVPYRCLVPAKLDGLLVTGLGISAHRDAMPILRMQPDIQNQGYAAGLAAAMAVRAGVEVRAVDVKELQRKLVAKGILPETTLAETDNFPLSDAALAQAVNQLQTDYSGLFVLWSDPARVKPLLRQAYQRFPTAEARLRVAHVLAMMGDAAQAQDVLAALAAMDWDPGWNYKGMSQFLRSVGWADSYMIALGTCGYRAALPAVVAKTRLLTAKSEYSHFRAVAKALEKLSPTGDDRRLAVAALSELLSRDGIGGRALKRSERMPNIPGHTNGAGDAERSLVLRELCVARALYNLGDDAAHSGERALRSYLDDPRRIYATYVAMVLKK